MCRDGCVLLACSSSPPASAAKSQQSGIPAALPQQSYNPMQPITQHSRNLALLQPVVKPAGFTAAAQQKPAHSPQPCSSSTTDDIPSPQQPRVNYNAASAAPEQVSTPVSAKKSIPAMPGVLVCRSRIDTSSTVTSEPGFQQLPTSSSSTETGSLEPQDGDSAGNVSSSA